MAGLRAQDVRPYSWTGGDDDDGGSGSTFEPVTSLYDVFDNDV